MLAGMLLTASPGLRRHNERTYDGASLTARRGSRYLLYVRVFILLVFDILGGSITLL